MHVSLIASTLFIFMPVASAATFVVYYLVLAAALWIVVAAIAVVNRGHIARPPREQPAV